MSQEHDLEDEDEEEDEETKRVEEELALERKRLEFEEARQRRLDAQHQQQEEEARVHQQTCVPAFAYVRDLSNGLRVMSVPPSVSSGSFEDIQEYDARIPGTEDLNNMEAAEVYNLLSSSFLFWGGSELNNKDIVAMAAFSREKFQDEAPALVVQRSRKYIEDIARLTIALQKKERYAWMRENNKVNSFYKVLQAIVSRIKDLSTFAMVYARATCDVDTSEFSSMSLQRKICDDMRRVHRCDRSKLMEATMLIQDTVANMGLKKYQGKCYQPVYVTLPCGKRVFARCYKEFKVFFDGTESSSIRDVIGHLNNDNSRVDLEWPLTVGYVDRVVSMMTKQEMVHLPSLKLNKSLRSFTNGVYDLVTDQFYSYGDEDMPAGYSVCCYDVPFRCDVMRAQYLSFTDFHGGWLRALKVMAPCFYKIVSWQYPEDKSSYKTESFNTYKDPEICIRTLCAFFGRLFHSVCRVDCGWEKLMGLIGHGGTGKSQLGMIATRIQPIHMIAKNDPEKVFGLWPLIGKDFILWEEASKASNFPYDVFLQIGSSRGRAGQKIAVSRKNDTQVDVHILATMLMIGNSAPPFNDEMSQVSRRFMAFLFDRPVVETDNSLSQGLQDELPVIMALCNRAYHCFHRGTRGENVDDYLHPDLLRDISEIMHTSSEISAFLNNEKSPVLFDKNGVQSAKIIPLSVLAHCFEEFVKRHFGVKAKNMSPGDLQKILNATKAKVYVESNDVRHDDLEYGYPTYSFHWPFIKNVGYKLSTQKTITSENAYTSAYVQGIEINWLKCPHGILWKGGEGFPSRSDGWMKKYMGATEKQRRTGLKRQRIGVDEKRLMADFYDKRKKAFSTREARGVRAHYRERKMKKTQAMENELQTDEHGVTKFDNSLIEELKLNIDLDLLAESGRVHRLRDAGKRFVGFEIAGCLARLRRVLRRCSRSASKAHLSALIKALEKVVDASKSWAPYY